MWTRLASTQPPVGRVVLAKCADGEVCLAALSIPEEPDEPPYLNRVTQWRGELVLTDDTELRVSHWIAVPTLP